MLSAYDIFFALQIAAFATVFSCILIEADNILEKYGDLLTELVNKGHRWIAWPLGYCEMCFAGQLAFWIWLFYPLGAYKSGVFEAIIAHASFIAITIFFTIPIKKIIKHDR